MKLLILSAFAPELIPIKQRLSTENFSTIKISNLTIEHSRYHQHDIYFALTGIGTVFASTVMSILSQHLSPDLVIFAGTAGGIASYLKIGDIIIPDKLIDIDLHGIHEFVLNTPFEESLINPHLNKQIPIEYPHMHFISEMPNHHRGLIVTSNYFPAPQFVFEKIKSLNPLAIDMESSAITQVGWLLGINTLIVRCISNLLNNQGADDDLAGADVSLCGERLADWVMMYLSKIA